MIRFVREGPEFPDAEKDRVILMYRAALASAYGDQLLKPGALIGALLEGAFGVIKQAQLRCPRTVAKRILEGLPDNGNAPLIGIETQLSAPDEEEHRRICGIYKFSLECSYDGQKIDPLALVAAFLQGALAVVAQVGIHSPKQVVDEIIKPSLLGRYPAVLTQPPD